MSTQIMLKMDKADFEALSSTYMAFNKSWNKQIKAGRFEGIAVNPGYSVIYWFDNPVSFIISISKRLSSFTSFRGLLIVLTFLISSVLIEIELL